MSCAIDDFLTSNYCQLLKIHFKFESDFYEHVKQISEKVYYQKILKADYSEPLEKVLLLIIKKNS